MVRSQGKGFRVRVLGTRLRALDNFVGFSGDHRHSTLLPLTKMLISSLPKLPKGAQCCKRNSLLFELYGVRTGPGKSWHFIVAFSRTGKSWNKSWKKATGPGKFR